MPARYYFWFGATNSFLSRTLWSRKFYSLLLVRLGAVVDFGIAPWEGIVLLADGCFGGGTFSRGANGIPALFLLAQHLRVQIGHELWYCFGWQDYITDIQCFVWYMSIHWYIKEFPHIWEVACTFIRLKAFIIVLNSYHSGDFPPLRQNKDKSFRGIFR